MTTAVQVKPHLREGHPVRGHVRILKKHADISNMGRHLWRWTKPEDEWTAEERDQAERTDRSIAEARAKGEWPNYGRWLPTEDISAVVTSKAELPATLYHVTSYRQAIEADGVIRVSNSFGQGGLGGVHLATHYTRDRAQAEMIRRELLRAGQIARGEVTAAVFATWAAEDAVIGGLPVGALDDAVSEAQKSYGVYYNDPSAHVRFKDWDYDLSPPSAEHLATATHEPVEGNEGTMHRFPDGSIVWEKRPDFWIWQAGPLEKPWSILNDAFDIYLRARSTIAFRLKKDAGAILDTPLLFGNSKAFEVATPENIAIIEVPTANIPDEALIVRPNANFNADGTERNDFLTEVRVYSDVPTDGAVFAAKGLKHVAPHLRGGTPVRGYTQWVPVWHGYSGSPEDWRGDRPDMPAWFAEWKPTAEFHGTVKGPYYVNIADAKVHESNDDIGTTTDAVELANEETSGRIILVKDPARVRTAEEHEVRKAKRVRVPPHQRAGHPVRGYVRLDPRAFSEEERALVERDFPVIERMAYASVLAQIGRGKHITFPQDAILDATDEGIRTYLEHHENPDWRKIVQKRIAGAVKDHSIWEQTHGVTGQTHALRMYMQETDPEERARLRELLPRFTGEEQAHVAKAPNPEEMVAELRSREEMVEQVERRYGVNVEKVRELLAARMAAPRGRPQLDVDRALRIFELRARGASNRTIAAVFGISSTAVQTAYTFIAKLMREVGRLETLERGPGSSDPKKSLPRRRQLGPAVQNDRLYRALARHRHALELGYPTDFVTDNRWLLTELLLDREATSGP